MSSQTRAAFLAEYRAARAAENFDRALEIGLAAIEYDNDHPDEPPLMGELRGLHLPAAA
jgi:hypothetical protein